MITIQKANIVLDIEPEDVDRYMALGYNVIDAAGNVVKQAIPTDLGTLQSEFVKNKEKIAALEAEIAKLKSAQKVEKVVQEVKAEPKKAVKKQAA